MSEIEARQQLWLLWILQAAIAGEEKGKGLELGLINRAFASDDQAHLAALEAASHKY